MMNRAVSKNENEKYGKMTTESAMMAALKQVRWVAHCSLDGRDSLASRETLIPTRVTPSWTVLRAPLPVWQGVAYRQAIRQEPGDHRTAWCPLPAPLQVEGRDGARVPTGTA